MAIPGREAGSNRLKMESRQCAVAIVEDIITSKFRHGFAWIHRCLRWIHVGCIDGGTMHGSTMEPPLDSRWFHPSMDPCLDPSQDPRCMHRWIHRHIHDESIDGSMAVPSVDPQWICDRSIDGYMAVPCMNPYWMHPSWIYAWYRQRSMHDTAMGLRWIHVGSRNGTALGSRWIHDA